jgi:ketosteroid isomerase-like protein
MIVVLGFVPCAPAPEEVVVEEPDTTEPDTTEPDTTEADIAAIREVVGGFYADRTEGNLEAEMELFAANAQVHRNQAPVLSGEDEIRTAFAWFHEHYDIVEFPFDPEEVLVSGDLGYLLNTFSIVRNDPDGETRTYYGSAIWILRRQDDGSWKITRYMWNDRPAGAE